MTWNYYVNYLLRKCKKAMANGSRKIPPGKIPTHKIPTHQTPPWKIPPPPENSHPFHQLSFFTISSLNTSSINGRRMYIYILPVEKNSNNQRKLTDFHPETYHM